MLETELGSITGGSERMRPRVLIEAYECSPVQGHAAGAAWQIISRLSRGFDVWVISEGTQYKDEISEYLDTHASEYPSLRFCFIDRKTTKRSTRRRPVLPIAEVRQYNWWLKQSLALATSLHKEIGFDLVHHLRGNSFRAPGYLWQLGVPFILGPIGGTYGVPWRLLPALGIRGGSAHALRNATNWLQLHILPNTRWAFSAAAEIIAQTSIDRDNFRRAFGRDSTVIHEQNAELGRARVRRYSDDRPLRIAWVGQCIARKGFPLLLRAIMANGLDKKVQVHIVGDGPYRRKWTEMAARANVASVCKWYGWLTHRDTRDIMDRCDLLAFTSLLEGTPATVMEALSSGLPVVSFGYSGAKDIIDGSCGCSIPVTTQPQMIRDFGSAIGEYIAGPDMLHCVSVGAAAKADEYSWDRAVDELAQLYCRTCARSSPTRDRS